MTKEWIDAMFPYSGLGPPHSFFLAVSCSTAGWSITVSPLAPLKTAYPKIGSAPFRDRLVQGVSEEAHHFFPSEPVLFLKSEQL